MSSRRATTARPVIFSLEPSSRHAQTSLANPANSELVRPHMGRNMIDVAFTLDHRGGLYPATMGKKGDVKIIGNFVANIQVSFELHEETGQIMLVDRSPSHTCSVSMVGRDGESREFDCFEALVLTPAASNVMITFGRPNSHVFALTWRMADPVDLRAWKSLTTRIGQVQTLESFPPTKRLEGPGDERPEKRFLMQRTLAENPSMRTRVAKCVDAYTGQFVAVKQVVDGIHRVFREKGEARKEMTTDLKHPHIIEFLQVEILVHRFNLVMELQDGDLDSLSSTGEFARPHHLLQDGNTVSRPLMHQMLQALDYLVSINIIHRDIKPKNILYRRINGSYHYRLADFGISTVAPHKRVFSGTQGYMAPEVRNVLTSSRPHTTRIDIWGFAWSFCEVFYLSLVRNDDEKLIVETTVHAISRSWSRMLGRMLDLDPFERPSAGHVLTLMFHGEGRVTEEC